MRSILFALIFIFVAVAIFLYVTSQNINIIILVIFAILIFHTIYLELHIAYLEVIDDEIEEIIKSLQDKEKK